LDLGSRFNCIIADDIAEGIGDEVDCSFSGQQQSSSTRMLNKAAPQILVAEKCQDEGRPSMPEATLRSANAAMMAHSATSWKQPLVI
jgi:hypothetical protein